MKLLMPFVFIVVFFVCIGVVVFIFFNKKLEQSKGSNQTTVESIQGQTNDGGKTGQPSTVSNNFGAAETSITLQILSPSDGSTVTTSAITLRGKTMPNAEVFVNDIELSADVNGNFMTNMTLEEGDNPIMVVVNDVEGRVAESEITVTYDTGE